MPEPASSTAVFATSPETGSQTGPETCFETGGSASICTEPIDAKTLHQLTVAVENDGAGAVVLFIGNVRNHHQGRTVEAITYTAYRTMAQERLGRIVEELGSDTLRLAIHHRIGRLEVGAASVAIATSSPHRQEAYAASRRALERLKAEVPIWKKEHYVGGESAWREEETLVAPD